VLVGVGQGQSIPLRQAVSVFARFVFIHGIKSDFFNSKNNSERKNTFTIKT
jgi:hypothetical protein